MKVMGVVTLMKRLMRISCNTQRPWLTEKKITEAARWRSAERNTQGRGMDPAIEGLQPDKANRPDQGEASAKQDERGDDEFGEGRVGRPKRSFDHLAMEDEFRERHCPGEADQGDDGAGTPRNRRCYRFGCLWSA